jgi:tartrate-resistant acid phosphatase type 5
MIRRIGLLCLVPLFALAALLAPRAARSADANASKDTKEVNLVAMGDWGINSPGQQMVAQKMKEYVAERVAKTGRKFDACLLAGDNFYVKLTGPEDPQIQTIFEEMYDKKVLDFPFYPALGNHDYQFGKYQIELDYAKENPNSRWKLPSRWYRVDLPAGAEKPLVTVLMLDSNKPEIVKMANQLPDSGKPGKKKKAAEPPRDLMSPQEWEQQKQWMDKQLSETKAEWTVACAHHPLFTNGAHGDNGVLQVEWGPIFKKHILDLYVAGHDHDLQHLEIQGWKNTFILVGGGGASTRPMIKDQRGPFSHSMHGFAHLQFTPDMLTVRFVDKTGKGIDEFTRTKEGKVSEISTIGMDKADPKPLNVIQGVDGKGKKKSVDD